jgi:hypothetical protein
VNLRLALAGIYLPRSVRKRELLGLFALTADAFEVPLPAFAGLSIGEALELYARWTNEQSARAAADSPRAAHVRMRLRERAIEFGSRIRRRLGLRTPAEVMRAGRLLYRFLRIDFQGSEPGDILIRRCSFSRAYTPETCALMGALDEGMLIGLSDGGRLEFSARITERSDACRAHFSFPEKLP